MVEQKSEFENILLLIKLMRESFIYPSGKTPFSEFFQNVDVRITGREEVDGVTRYTIRIGFIGRQDLKATTIKRYSEFVDFKKDLKKEGCKNLPKLPKKILFPSKADLDQRQQQLEQFLVQLLSREDIFMSSELVALIGHSNLYDCFAEHQGP